MDHSHMNHGDMGHGGMDHGGMDHGGGMSDMCSMNVSERSPAARPNSLPAFCPLGNGTHTRF